jgi:tetratricopeptide (TPR) repeat protein
LNNPEDRIMIAKNLACDDILMDLGLETPEFDAPSSNREGLALYGRGDFLGAVEQFEKATEVDPNFAEAWNNAGVVRQRLGNLQGAIADFSRAIEVNPSYADAHNNLARALHLRGDPLAAAAQYDRALGFAEGSFRAVILHNRGMLSRETGPLAEVIRDFDRALAIAPDQVVTLLARGNARKEAGDLDGALADFEDALKLAGPADSAEILHRRGGVRVLLKDFAGAVDDYDRAPAIDPHFLTAYISRGHARYHLRDPRSVVDYRRALRMNPESAAREIARFCFEDIRRDPEAVLKNCDQHLRLEPRDAIARARRGIALVILGREATEDLMLFAALVPDLAEDVHRIVEIAKDLRSGAR